MKSDYNGSLAPQLRPPASMRKQVLDATRVLLEETSFDRLDIKSVAELAKTTRRTVYNQFLSKEDLYRSSREEIIFGLARKTVCSIPERMELIDGFRFIAQVAHETFSDAGNREINHSIMRDGHLFPWLETMYHQLIVAPLVSACEVYLTRRSERRPIRNVPHRAIAELFISMINDMGREGREDRVSVPDTVQLEILASAFAMLYAENLASAAIPKSSAKARPSSSATHATLRSARLSAPKVSQSPFWTPIDSFSHSPAIRFKRHSDISSSSPASPRCRCDRENGISIEEVARHRGIGDDGSSLIVVEYRRRRTAHGKSGARDQIGAAWAALVSGETVRYIDPETFEVILTGELVRVITH